MNIAAPALAPTPVASLDPDTFVKREETQPWSRTHKDRRSALIIARALRDGITHLAVITAGNAGYSLIRGAEGTGIAVTCLVGQSVSASIRGALAAAGGAVRPVDLSVPLTPQAIADLARRFPLERVADASNSAEGAYASLWHEISGLRPDTIVCPVGSGELMNGLAQGVRESGARTRIWGVTVTAPDSRADKLRASWTPYHEKIRALLGHGHRLVTVSEDDVERSVALIPAGVEAEPSAAVVYVALGRYRDELGRTVLINTGSGLR